MTSILIGWVNEELQLDPPLTEATLAGELSSGFVLGALLHRHNQLPQHHKLRRRDTADSKIQNFCLLEPALCKLGVRFDANVAHGIMRATPGSAAMVLYQLKIALDKLVKFATPVSLHASRDGVQPLPNLPARPSKPQFDGARARLFEASVRLRADNPNDVLMKRHLRRFEDEAEKMENARLREKEAAVEELGRQLEASRASRIYQRQQEAAFLASWEARGLEHWAANRQRAFDRKAQRARTIARLADDGSMRRLRARKAECAAMKSEVDGFERRLATRDATAKASAPDAFDELEEVDRDDPLSQYSRSVAPTVEIGVGVGGNSWRAAASSSSGASRTIGMCSPPRTWPSCSSKIAAAPTFASTGQRCTTSTVRWRPRASTRPTRPSRRSPRTRRGPRGPSRSRRTCPTTSAPTTAAPP